MDIENALFKNVTRSNFVIAKILAVSSIIMVLCDIAIFFKWIPVESPFLKIAVFIAHAIIGIALALFLFVYTKVAIYMSQKIKLQEETLQDLASIAEETSKVYYGLVNSVSEVSGMSKNALDASKQIAASAADVAAGSKETLNFINDATDAAVNISKDLDEIAKEYIFVSSISQQLKIMTDDSRSSIKNTIDEISTISENTTKTKNTIYSLKERTSKIEKVVEVITGIANNTSLLSLNASIESAKAGEYGKGFSVVASEVKKLAEQSHKSAQEISQMIKGILTDTDLAVKDIDTTAELVSKSMEVISNSANTFEMISVASEEVNDKIQGVTSLTQVVSKNGDNIVQIVKNIRDINSKSLTELSSIAEASENQMVSLEQITGSIDNVEKLSKKLLDTYSEK